MCLAVAPNKQCSNGILSRLWRSVASTPLRLLSMCALFHAVILAGLAVVQNPAAVDASVYAFALAYGLLALLAFGALLTWLPRKYSQSPVHYARYSSIYLFMMAGMILIETGMFLGGGWMVAGMLLLVPGWLIALQSLRHVHGWMSRNTQRTSRILMLLLAINFVCLGLTVLGQMFTAATLTQIPALVSMLVLWPGVFAVSLTLLLTAPANGRVISL